VIPWVGITLRIAPFQTNLVVAELTGHDWRKGPPFVALVAHDVPPGGFEPFSARYAPSACVMVSKSARHAAIAASIAPLAMVLGAVVVVAPRDSVVVELDEPTFNESGIATSTPRIRITDRIPIDENPSSVRSQYRPRSDVVVEG
jgi:hypothetical protein